VARIELAAIDCELSDLVIVGMGEHSVVVLSTIAGYSACL